MPKPALLPTATVHPQQNVPAPMDISDAGPEAFSKALFNVQDIDANDKENPQLVSEYVNDIYEYMRVLEVLHFFKYFSEVGLLYPHFYRVIL